MSEEIKNGGQAAGTTQPEGNGVPQGGKTFTQEEVNKIVSERLARQRAKQEPQDPAAERLAELDQREKDLTARENKLTCTEYIKEKGLNAELAELFDTSNADQFKANVDKLLEIYPSIASGAPRFTTKTGLSHQGGHAVGSLDRSISDAFKP